MAYSATINKRCQDPKSPTQQPQALSSSSVHTNTSTRLLVCAAATLLIIASAGFGMLFAWQVGSRHDAVLGALSVAMALGLELSKPFAISSAFASLRQWRVNGSVIDLSQRKLARQIGASRTTLQRALNDLAAAGHVLLDTGRNGTRLALAS